MMTQRSMTPHPRRAVWALGAAALVVRGALVGVDAAHADHGADPLTVHVTIAPRDGSTGAGAGAGADAQADAAADAGAGVDDAAGADAGVANPGAGGEGAVAEDELAGTGIEGAAPVLVGALGLLIAGLALLRRRAVAPVSERH